MKKNCALAALALTFYLAAGLTPTWWTPTWLVPVSAARAEITADEVREAITRGVEFLKRRQKARGDWVEPPEYNGGVTALCVLAMLNCGTPPDDPAVAKGLDFLRGLEMPDKTYVVALQIMALCEATPEKDLQLIKRNVRWLEAAQLHAGENRGGWAYDARPRAVNSGDNSNAQFAVLALHEAERVGVEVDPAVWKLAAEHWKSQVLEDGGWGYGRRNFSYGSMTCAGIASLVITQDKLYGDASVSGGAARCCGPQAEAELVENGLRWFGRRGAIIESHPSTEIALGARNLLYYLYALERVGRLTGRRFIGGRDWYREGSEFLVHKARNKLSGSWVGEGIGDGNELVATAFALLFLSKGRRPVVIAKLQHADDGHWDSHRGGVGKLTAHVEQRWKQNLTWQTIDPRGAQVVDLLESPVLFLSGQKALSLDKASAQKLKEYVLQGGFIFAEACDGDGCDGAAFTASFHQLMRELFPENTLRPLRPDHPIWHAEETVRFAREDHPRWLWGLDACCRTSVVLCPANLSCYWELKRTRKTDYPEALQQEIAECLALGANVLTYATNRELKRKLDRPRVAVSDDADARLPRGVLHLPKLSHGGGADEARNGWPNLLGVLAREGGLRVSQETGRKLLAPTDPALIEYPLVFFHGRRDFSFTPSERAALRAYIERGGVLFGDSICGNAQFAAAVRREVELILPGRKLERVPATHPLFTTKHHGYDIRSVTLRDPQARDEGDPLKVKPVATAPLLEGVEIDGRHVVLFSPHDLSCALENQASIDCKGYGREDAARIGVNVILYALQQ